MNFKLIELILIIVIPVYDIKVTLIVLLGDSYNELDNINVNDKFNTKH